MTTRALRALAQAMSVQAPGVATAVAAYGLDADALNSFADLVRDRAEQFVGA